MSTSDSHQKCYLEVRRSERILIAWLSSRIPQHLLYLHCFSNNGPSYFALVLVQSNRFYSYFHIPIAIYHLKGNHQLIYNSPMIPKNQFEFRLKVHSLRKKIPRFRTALTKRQKFFAAKIEVNFYFSYISKILNRGRQDNFCCQLPCKILRISVLVLFTTFIRSIIMIGWLETF